MRLGTIRRQDEKGLMCYEDTRWKERDTRIRDKEARRRNGDQGRNQLHARASPGSQKNDLEHELQDLKSRGTCEAMRDTGSGLCERRKGTFQRSEKTRCDTRRQAHIAPVRDIEAGVSNMWG